MSRHLIGGSVTFDHAADSYDATRALPEPIARKLTEALVAELRAASADRVLEVGTGTGRIARPLAEHGVRVTGLDVAPRMLARFREQLGPQHTRPDLLLGDATRLPVQSGSFRAVLVVHVLHLVSSHEQALSEVRRVLASDGVFLHPVTHYPGDNPWRLGIEKWDKMLAARDVLRRPRPTSEQIADALRAAGGSRRAVVFAEGEDRGTPASWLERTRQRIDSWSWEVPDDVFPECFAEYEAWCRDHYGDLEREYVQQVSYELEVWSFGDG